MGGDGMFVCGVEPTAPSDALRAIAGLAHCCESVMLRGPLACTCWTVEYDLQQAEPHEGVTAAQIVTRAQMCADCAYRPDSPERTGDDAYVEPPASARSATFWCHQGMRKPVRFRHPLGIVVEASGDFYQPPIGVGPDGCGLPFKADGSPGDRCAGWAAALRSETVGLHVVLEDLDPDYQAPPGTFDEADIDG